MGQSSKTALVWSVLNGLGTKALNFVVYLFLAKSLGPATFGVFAIAQAAAAFLEIVCEHKFSVLLIQRSTLSEEEKSSVFWFQMTLGLASAIGLISVAKLLSTVFSAPELGTVVAWLSIAMVLNVAGFVQESLIKRDLKFKIITARGIASNVFGGVIGVVMAYLGHGVYALLAMAIATALTGTIVLWISSIWRPRFIFNKSIFLPMYRTVRPLAATGVAGAMALHANTFIIGHSFGTAVAGYYSFALKIYDVLMRVTVFSISDALLPIFSRKTADTTEFRTAFKHSILSNGMLTVAMLILAAALSGSLIEAFFGEPWRPAAPYLMIYLLCGAIISLGSYNDITLLAYGQVNRVSIIYLFGMTIWCLQLPFVDQIGPMFPVIAWCVKEICVFPIKAFWAINTISMPWKEYVRSLVLVVFFGMAAAIPAVLILHIDQINH